jgi:DNA-binding NarL/FixJ family response regulator
VTSTSYPAADRMHRVERYARAGDPLTERQRSILIAAADGLTYTEIATRLGVHVQTVKAHAGVIFTKLGAVSMTNAVAIYLSSETESRGWLRALVCVVRGHVVEWGPCDFCGRRAKG